VLTVFVWWIVGIVSRFVGIVSGFYTILQDFFVRLTVLTMLTVFWRVFHRKGLEACSLATAAAFAVLDADLAQGGCQAFEPCAEGVGSAGPVPGVSDVFVHQITEGLPEVAGSSAPFAAVSHQRPHGPGTACRGAVLYFWGFFRSNSRARAQWFGAAL